MLPAHPVAVCSNDPRKDPLMGLGEGVGSVSPFVGLDRDGGLLGSSMLEEVLPHIVLDCTSQGRRGRVVRCDDQRCIGESADKRRQSGA